MPGEVVASQENVTCGGRSGSMSRILRSRIFGHGGVSIQFGEPRRMRTCNITHLMIIEHSFTTLITGHVGHVAAIHVDVYSPACQRETDTGRVIFTYCAGRVISVNSHKRGQVRRDRCDPIREQIIIVLAYPHFRARNATHHCN